MKARHFVKTLDHPRILRAIADAEKTTCGTIQAYISHREIADAVKAAQTRFDKLGLAKKSPAALVYLAPESRVFAVIGDAAIHEKCGDAFWQDVTAVMTQHLKSDSPTTAIVHAVERIGALLAEHFPASAGARKTLSGDAVTEE